MIKHLTKEEMVGRPWISITTPSGKEYDLMPALIVLTLLILWSM